MTKEFLYYLFLKLFEWYYTARESSPLLYHNYTEQNYKRNTFVFPPFFMSWTFSWAELFHELNFFMSWTFSWADFFYVAYTKCLFLSNIVHKSV